MEIIDGFSVAKRLREQLAEEVSSWVKAGNSQPGLATILVGDDPASAVYVGGKQRACSEVGIKGFDHRLPADASFEAVAGLISQLNADPEVNGILLQLPVPKHLDGDRLTGLIDPLKDVDGLTPVSAGLLASGREGLVPCTPSGVIRLLDAYEVPIEGANAVVLGRSNLVGKPVASLLLQRNATVTICHSRSRNSAAICSEADILVVAVGIPELVDASYVKQGATVIDVGINRVDDRLVGDVNFAAVSEKAGLITPVPRGVGPMTIACLLSNTLRAAELQIAGKQ